MEQKLTFLKPKHLEIVKNAGLLDSREIVCFASLSQQKTKSQLAKEAAKEAVKAVFTSVLFGYYKVSAPISVVVALQENVVFLITELNKKLEKMKAKTIAIHPEEVERMFTVKGTYVCIVFKQKEEGQPSLQFNIILNKKTKHLSSHIIDTIGRDKFIGDFDKMPK